jgi:tryptophan halogenase
MQQQIKRVVIAGGGTAGWMTAAAISTLIGKRLDICLVESDDISTVGVGEATIPTLLTMHRLLKIPEPEFLKAVNGTFKLGIEFENWKKKDHKYIHSFGISGESCWAAGFHQFWTKARQQGHASEYGEYCAELKAAEQNKFAVTSNPRMNYAYHLDSGLYGQYLRKLAEAKGVKRIEGKIEHVLTSQLDGSIESLKLESGQVIDGDLFIDCTGFRALLMSALDVGYDDWSDSLPNDSAYAVQTESLREPIPYTRSIAMDAGWRWQIPLQNRVGNGHVFSSKFKTNDSALDDLMGAIEGKPITEPRLIRFTTGQRNKHWHKNCVAIGLSSGFIEPLESTSIHLIQQGILWLIRLFPSMAEDTLQLTKRFNQQMRTESETIRDFIVLHYKLTERTDTDYWKYLKSMPVSERLEARMSVFQSNGSVIDEEDDLFAENSWVQVMLGQGITPEHYHPIVDMMSDVQLNDFMQQQKQKVEQMLTKLPTHQQFIEHYMKI